LSINVPTYTSLYANNVQLMYYSQHFGSSIFDKQRLYINQDMTVGEEWQKFHYLAVRENDDYAEKLTQTLKQNGLKPIKVFANNRGDRVAIYRREEKAL
jgi:hypothetical protein